MALAPTLTTQNIPTQKTAQVAANTAIVLGARLTFDSTGFCGLAASTVRGDYIALEKVASQTYTQTILVAPIAAGGSVGVATTGTNAVGDSAYSAANGLSSNVSTNTVLLGKYLQASTNGIAIVELESVS